MPVRSCWFLRSLEYPRGYRVCAAVAASRTSDPAGYLDGEAVFRGGDALLVGEDILKRARTECGDLDEREQAMIGPSFCFAGVVKVSPCVPLVVLQLPKGMAGDD